MKLEDLDKVIALRGKLNAVNQFLEAVSKRSESQKVMLVLFEPAQSHVANPATVSSLDVSAFDRALIESVKHDIIIQLKDLGVTE